ncbi:MAG TPA: adenosine deaminase [Candidatus Limnocylindrales bacterium]|nr:adenosine deaminase [Candidatus Limnocylindrales bacterium]
MVEAQAFTAWPKAELHLHLDGSVRPSTVLELATRDGVPLPTRDLEQLHAWLSAPDDCPSLRAYIHYFELPIAVMQTADALERVTRELGEDLAKDGVRYAEIRYAPWLHVTRGLALKDVIAATLRGWRAAKEAHALEGGILVTAMRDMPPQDNLVLAQVAGGFAGQGVIGFDLAGDEEGHPPILHEDAFRAARSLGLPITIHAGEGAGAESVRQAITMGATRIGHGVRAQEDPEVVAMARDEGVQFDMAPSSNVHTKAVRRLDEHPLLRYRAAGIKVTISTDSRTVSQTTLAQEYARVHEVLRASPDELWAIDLQALDGGFADRSVRDRLRREFEAHKPV